MSFLSDAPFQAVDQVETWIGKTAVHDITSGSVSFAGPGHVGTQSGPHDEGPRLCGADHKIVKIAAHLESA